jgi:hypothetical protein
LTVAAEAPRSPKVELPVPSDVVEAEEYVRVLHPPVFSDSGPRGIWHQPLELALREETGSELDAAVAAHASGGDRTGVFSSEGLHELPLRSVRLICEKLDETQIIMFIRRQDLATNSLLNQYAKAHRVPFVAVSDFERNITNYNLHFDYWEILSL